MQHQAEILVLTVTPDRRVPPWNAPAEHCHPRHLADCAGT